MIQCRVISRSGVMKFRELLYFCFTLLSAAAVIATVDSVVLSRRRAVVFSRSIKTGGERVGDEERIHEAARTSH